MSESEPTTMRDGRSGPEPGSPIFFMARKAFQACVPFTAVVELTYRCNFRCSMCYVLHDRTEGELATDEWRNVFDQLAAMGTLYLELSGGEPLLRPDLWSLLEHAQKRKFLVVLFTNASLATPDKVERLKRFRNLVALQVSLYGGDPETFDRVSQVPGAYHRAVEGLRRLTGAGFKVRVRTPLVKDNIATVDGMRVIARGAGCAQFQCAPLITPRDDGGAGPAGERISDQQMRDFWLREKVEAQIAPRIGWTKPLCTAGRSLIGISPQGVVSPCIQLHMPAGNVRDRPLRELWQAPVFEEVRGFRFAMMAKCHSCSVAGFCAPCVGINLLETGDVREPSAEICRIAALKAEAWRERLRRSADGDAEPAADVTHCVIG